MTMMTTEDELEEMLNSVLVYVMSMLAAVKCQAILLMFLLL